ncbi:MAG: multi-sensor hybrid histidine kinase [Thermoleophilia bacterium]|nr:multi-sensor hybrid histidine kinase [Thermoleophilia bacterium]
MSDVASFVLPVAALVGGLVAFVLAILDLRRDPQPGYAWFAATIPAFVAAAVPFEPFGFRYDTPDHAWAWRLPVALVVILPALLLHLVEALSGHGGSRLVRGCDALTAGIVAWLLLMPTLPGPSVSSPPWWYQVGFGVFLLQFLATIIVSVWMLVAAARGATGAARMRGRLLAATLACFGAAYLVWFARPNPTIELFMSWTALGAGLLLWLAIRAPRRTYDALARGHIDPWLAIEGLVASSNVRAELPKVLAATAHDWGLVALAALDADDVPIDVVGSCSLAPSAARASRPVRVRATNAAVGMEAWASPLTPPLRRGDRQRLTMLAHLIELALAREDTARRRREVDAASQDVEQRVLHVQEQLERAEAIRDRAARIVASDMRSPITALLGLTDALETRWHELPSDQLQPLQQLVARQVARLASVVDKLLVLSAIEEGSLRSVPEPVDVRRLVASVLETGIDADVTYRCDDPAARCIVQCEPVALREILTQLLDNAASHGSPSIEIHLASDADRVLIEVLDHGQGVRDSFVPHLFDRFTRDSPKVERGLGLGLAIVHELAGSLDGRVGYRRDDERTVFWLRLPQAHQTPA